MAKALLVDEKLFSDMFGKDVVIRIRSSESEIHHEFGPVTFISMENQKSTGMRNAPEKRMKDGKAYTPPMITLKFAGSNDLVFIVEDMRPVARYKGVTFVFDNYYVDVVEYQHEL
jgi:hypothetical protein